MSQIPGLFITGTDTAVGKTYVAALIARALAATGLRVGVYKPAASGCRYEGDKLVSDDALAKGCAGMVQCDHAMVTAVRKKADQVGAKAQLFASMKRNTARQEALAFVGGMGYRVRPGVG